MTDSTQLYKPEAPASLRKGVYFIGIFLGAFALLAVGVVAIFWRDYAMQALALAGIVNSVWLYLSNQLAVLFVPPTITGNVPGM